MSTKTPKPNFAAQLTTKPASAMSTTDQILYQGGAPAGGTARLVEPLDEMLPDDAIISQTTGITKRNYIRLAQASFWCHVEQQEIIEAALELYLDSMPEADKQMPEKQHQRLLNLKKLRR